MRRRTRIPSFRDRVWPGLALVLLATTDPLRAEGGQVDVRSDPSKTHIAINGRHFGFTPLSNVALEPGKYLITASRAGYRTSQTWVMIETGAHAQVQLELEQRWGCAAFPYVHCLFQLR